MSADLSSSAIEYPINTNRGLVWNRLHSEREEVCEALLKEFRPPEAQEWEVSSSEQTRRIADWHRDLLQERLRKLDDALDRLMTGSYGSCSKCGRWIQDSKLEFDSAVAFCIECWDRQQTKH